ncbi:hypothetical protein SAMN04488543_2968 [Friedmanniella luteola]|uniref:Hpt domain-containing protein n=1 Tax=Friedmanniella luteola TaxID=546871 RepID=A0A1H1XDF5_9ACTN|nr:hypothetical protein [Friedmanniella luteola]SDT07333.1 hypothetical protein SAMN04488543_2968 [Friedmanniella luteola]
MPAGEAGNGPDLSHGERSVHPHGPRDRSAEAPQASRPAAPTREWQMTPQEQDMMACFRQDYLDLLDGRVATIERLVVDHEVEPAHVALLSLESSSAMVGASGLAAAVRQLRTALEGGGTEELETLTARMAVEAAEVARRLGEPVA